MLSNGTEGLVCSLFPAHLLTCCAEFLQDPQAFWLWLHSFQNIHQTTTSSLEITATEAFPPSP